MYVLRFSAFTCVCVAVRMKWNLRALVVASDSMINGQIIVRGFTEIF